MQTCEIKRITNRPGYKYVTCGESCWTTKKGEKIIIPSGFLTDGSTSGPDVGFSWLFHDWLYATHKIGDRIITKKEADEIMCEILAYERAPTLRKVVGFIFKLNPLWLVSRAWKTSGERGPEFYHQDDYFSDSVALL